MKKSWLRIALAGLCVGTVVGLLVPASSAAASPPTNPASPPTNPACAHAKPGTHKQEACAPKRSTLGTGEFGDTWMHDLGSRLWNRRLADIMIPASHDSTTYSFPPGLIGTPIAQTQDEDLTAQLNGGMRQFDVRVEYNSGNAGLNYYAHHGSDLFDQFSSWLTLSRIFSDIAAWANAPGHEQEVILLSLSIAQDGAAFPTSDCQSFAQNLGSSQGSSLILPVELQDSFGTTDPGQVTLGQLWSLPDPTGAARVIMDNTQCLAAAAGPLAGQWGSFLPPGQALYSGYYADQCTAFGIPGQPDQQLGIADLVVGAAKTRATGGTGAEPIPLGPAKVGGVYVLNVQGTPDFDCLRLPYDMLPDEIAVLNTLYQQFMANPSSMGGLVVSGDFVEDTNLFRFVTSMDGTYPQVADAISLTGAAQVNATQDAPSVPASAFAALATYQETGIASDVIYQVTGPDWDELGFGPDRRTTVTVQANPQGVVSPGADLYLSQLRNTGSWTITATAGDSPNGAVLTSWTVVVTTASGFQVQAPDAGLSAQAGQTFTYAAPGAQYSIWANAVSAKGGYLPDVPVTFDLGLAGTFAGGRATVTISTSTRGPAFAPPFTAGTRAGTFVISITAAGAANSVSVPFTVTPGPAATFVATRGDGQSTPIRTTFPAALTGHWLDQYSNVVTQPPPADLVLTLSPSSGGTWPNGQSSVQVSPDANGTITAPDLTAGSTVLNGPDAAHSLIVQVGSGSGWTLHVTPGPAAKVTATSGNGQQTGVGKPFAQPWPSRSPTPRATRSPGLRSSSRSRPVRPASRCRRGQRRSSARR